MQQPDIIERHPMVRVLLALTVVIVAIFALSTVWQTLVQFGDVLLLFFLAWIVAFILEPVSLVLQRRHIPRVLAVSVIYLALLVVLSGAIVLAIPSIGSEIRLLASEITAATAPGNLSAMTVNATVTLEHLGLSPKNAAAVVKVFSGQIPKWAEALTNDAVNTTAGLFASVLGVLFDTFIVLILSFYIMMDGDHLVERIVRRIPPAWVPDVRLFQSYVDQIFGGFFRAQLIVAVIYGVLNWIILLVFHQANSLLVALVAGILMLLPFIGTVLSLVPPLLLVLLQSPNSDVVRNLIIVFIALILAQQVVLQVIAPRVFGAQMGIHPLILFAALLLGAKEGGVWGAFFAGPVVAVCYAMLRVYYDRLMQRSALFKPLTTDSEPLREPELEKTY